VGFGFFFPDAFLTFKIRARRERFARSFPTRSTCSPSRVEAGSASTAR
jgi:hypothetical protein